MKAKLILLLLVVASCVIKAQTPWVFPGNAPSAGDFLGSTVTVPLELKTTNTTTPQPINFYTNNTQKMTIVGSSGATDGYVGIGTTSPWNLLHIDGAGNPAYSQFTNTVTGNGSGTTGLLVGVDGSGNAILNNNFTTGNMNFYTNATQYMTILGTVGSAGYVGIGNSFTPQYLLDVDGTIAVKKILIKTNGNVQDLFVLVEELQTQIIELKSQLALTQTNSK